MFLLHNLPMSLPGQNMARFSYSQYSYWILNLNLILHNVVTITLTNKTFHSLKKGVDLLLCVNMSLELSFLFRLLESKGPKKIFFEKWYYLCCRFIHNI